MCSQGSVQLGSMCRTVPCAVCDEGMWLGPATVYDQLPPPVGLCCRQHRRNFPSWLQLALSAASCNITCLLPFITNHRFYR